MPPNDNCVNATMLTVASVSCGTAKQGTNINATDSGIDHDDCADYAGGDIWFGFTAPSSGNVNLEISNDPDDIADAIHLFESCGSTAISCYTFTDGGLMSLSGLTPSADYKFALWEQGNSLFGNFEICAYEPANMSTDPCIDGYTGANALTGFLTVSTHFNTDQSIASNQLIGSGLIVGYSAGSPNQSVTLLSPFEVLSNTTFTVDLNGCD